MTRAGVRHLVIGYAGVIRGPRPYRTWCGAPATKLQEHAFANTPAQPVCAACTTIRRNTTRARRAAINGSN